MVLFVKADDQQISASSMITALDVNIFSCRCTNYSSLAVRPFMAIEFFSWVLPVAESVWSDIKNRSTNIELSIHQSLLVSVLARFAIKFIVNYPRILYVSRRKLNSRLTIGLLAFVTRPSFSAV